MKRKKFILACCCLLSALPALSKAEDADALTVTAAATFAPAVEEVGKMFTEKTAVPVQIKASSSGKFYGQIRNGAPFDLFLSADTKRPELLFKDKFCEQPKEYAHCSVVLWSLDKAVCEKAGTWQKAVQDGGLKKIGIASPDAAPYGAAAKAALTEANLWTAAEPRLVSGADVEKAMQYAVSGAADASFISMPFAKSEAGRKGCFLAMPEAKPIVQSGCVISASKRKEQAEKFMEFLRSDAADAVFAKYGYVRPAAGKP